MKKITNMWNWYKTEGEFRMFNLLPTITFADSKNEKTRTIYITWLFWSIDVATRNINI